MLKSKGLLILFTLAILAPSLGYAFPSFNKEKDMLKLLFSAAEDIAVQGDLTKRSNIKLSDGKTYLITFTQQEVRGPKRVAKAAAPGNPTIKISTVFDATFIPAIMRGSDPAKIADIKAFTRLLKFQEKLTDHGTKDMGELTEIGALYNSSFIKDQTAEELRALLTEYVTRIRNTKLESASLKLALKQLVDLLELHEKSNSEPGFKFINKVGTHEGKVQKYVLKLRQFTPLHFELTRVNAASTGGGTPDNTNSDAAFSIITNILTNLGFTVIDDLTDAATITVKKANFGAKILDDQQNRLLESTAGYSRAKDASAAATAAGEPNAASAATVVQTFANVIGQFVTQYNTAQPDDTKDITFTP